MSEQVSKAADPTDQSHFSDAESDKVKIGAAAWVPCRVCWEVFMRLRLTARYCASCERAFCEGEHGNFTGGRGGVCVRCFSRSGMQLKSN